MLSNNHKKFIVWCKLENDMYKLDTYSDDSMFTLHLCLNDGLGTDSYLNFLEDYGRLRFCGNICSMQKIGKMVFLSIHENIIPDLPVFTTSAENVIKMYKEIRKLKSQGVSKISLSIGFDTIRINTD